MIKNKKSQITVFIIIGVILLFSTALVIYIKNQVSVPVREVKVAVEQVPTEVQPVQVFVTECLEQVSKEALNLIGAHGGYIGTDSASFEYTGANFEKNDAHPTEADVVAFPPNAKNYVPYWEYMRPPDKCEVCYLGSWRPPLYRTEGGNSIESQADKYVENNLRKCLRNFGDFRSEGYSITEAGGIKATTYVRERDVLVSLNYPIDISKGGGEKTRMTLYQVALPVGLKKIYDMAKYIIDTSASSRFLGMNTLNLISGFSRVDGSMLPPFRDLAFTYDTVTWSKQKVKTLLTQMLEVYVPALQMEGVRNFNSPAGFQDPIMKGLYGEMVLQGKEVSNLETNFIYLGWPIYLDFVGSNSDTLKPSNLEMPLLNLLPFKDYRFVYDISYPVIVRISDPDAYSGKGYMFAFAMEANIRNNEAVNNEFATIPAITKDVAPVSEFCKELHRNSGLITVKVYDAETRKPLEGANVVFRSSQQCSLGTTTLDDNSLSATFETAFVTAKFPVGIGTLIISRPGYQTKYEKFATAVGKEDEKSIYLNPMKTLNVTVLKKKIIGTSFFSTGLLGMPENLTPKDIVMVNLEKIKDYPEEEPIVSAVAFGMGVNSSMQSIMLVPGKYRVMEVLILNETVKIPKEEICTGGLFGIGEKCVDIPELVFNSYIFPSTEFEWEVTEDDLFGARNAEFYVVYSTLPKEHEDLNTITAQFQMFNNNINYIQYKPALK